MTKLCVSDTRSAHAEFYMTRYSQQITLKTSLGNRARDRLALATYRRVLWWGRLQPRRGVCTLCGSCVAPTLYILQVTGRYRPGKIQSPRAATIPFVFVGGPHPEILRPSKFSNSSERWGTTRKEWAYQPRSGGPVGGGPDLRRRTVTPQRSIDDRRRHRRLMTPRDGRALCLHGR